MIQMLRAEETGHFLIQMLRLEGTGRPLIQMNMPKKQKGYSVRQSKEGRGS